MEKCVEFMIFYFGRSAISDCNLFCFNYVNTIYTLKYLFKHSNSSITEGTYAFHILSEFIKPMDDHITETKAFVI